MHLDSFLSVNDQYNVKIEIKVKIGLLSTVFVHIWATASNQNGKYGLQHQIKAVNVATYLDTRYCYRFHCGNMNYMLQY